VTIGKTRIVNVSALTTLTNFDWLILRARRAYFQKKFKVDDEHCCRPYIPHQKL